MTDDEKRTLRFRGALLAAGLSDPPAFEFPESIDGLSDYLADVYGSMASYFSAKELARPNQASIAEELGYHYLIPPSEWFPRVALLRYIADGVRHSVGWPVKARNLWRPVDYNWRVATSGPDSDHPHCCAIDLDYESYGDFYRGLRFLRSIYSSGFNLQMSLGAGWYGSSDNKKWTTHVGLFSPKGHRQWDYPIKS